MSPLFSLFVVLTCFMSECLGFNYNDTCSITPECDPSRFLECVNYRCLCKPQESAYISNVCRLLANNRCQIPNTPGIQPCAPHSDCSGDPPICNCKPNFTPNKENRCFLDHESSCDMSAIIPECDPLAFLQCTTAGCRCDERNAKYEPTIPSCLLLIDAPCTLNLNPNQPCVPNAQCRTIGSTPICTCDYPFIKNSKRECSLPFGEICERGNDLCSTDRFLTCGDAEGRCICSNEQNSWFYPPTGFCLVKANSQCSVGGQPCVPNAVCQPGTDGFSQCQCQGDFEPNSSGQCVLGYGKKCNSIADECNKETHTYCTRDGECKCQNELNTVYDPIAKTCKLLVNTSCSASILPSQQCVSQSHCSLPEGICKCNPGFEISVDRKCIIPYGKPCDRNGENLCDWTNFQQCGGNNVCECQRPMDSIFDPILQRCFLRHSASCLPNEDKNPPLSQQCGINSICDLETKKCICDGKDLEPNDERICVLNHGKTCNRLNDKCDPYGYLECGTNSICTCQNGNDTWYDEFKKKCTLRHGSPCAPDANGQQCIERSTCELSPGNVPYRCECNPTMVPTKNRRCFFPYEANCDVQTDYCDREDGFMTCLEPRLQCGCIRTDMVYDHAKKQCFILPGGECSPISGNPECGNNSQCSLDGKCKCRTGYEETGNANCLKSYSTPCSFSNECNHENHLACLGGKCICNLKTIPETDPVSGQVFCMGSHGQICSQAQPCSRNAYLSCASNGICQCLSPLDQEFFTGVAKCLSLAGTPCHLNTPPEIYSLQCMQNSSCQSVSNSTEQGEIYGICMCNPGLTETTERYCSSGIRHLGWIKIFALIFMFQIWS